MSVPLERNVAVLCKREASSTGEQGKNTQEALEENRVLVERCNVIFSSIVLACRTEREVSIRSSTDIISSKGRDDLLINSRLVRVCSANSQETQTRETPYNHGRGLTS